MINEDDAYDLVRTTGFSIGFHNALKRFVQQGMIDEELADALLQRHNRKKDNVGRGGPIITCLLYTSDAADE